MSALPDIKLINHGIEIIETTRIQELIEQAEEHFEMECFTATERNTPPLGAKRIEYLAGRFAAKKAILKALGIGNNPNISKLDIEIQRLPSGEPSVVLHGKCQEIAAKLSITKWLLSISHTSSYAAASAIAFKGNGTDLSVCSKRFSAYGTSVPTTNLCYFSAIPLKGNARSEIVTKEITLS